VDPIDAASLDPLSQTELQPGRAVRRLTALFEVLLCSSFPTQLAIAYILGRTGAQPFGPDGRLSSDYVITLALADSLVLVGLIVLLLLAHGERPRELFLGTRPRFREAMLGIALIPVVFGIVVVAMLGIQRIAPWLHNVAKNPLEDLIESRADAGIFVVVAVVAGGIREEVQRAFILHRFEQHLGGVWVGLVVFSLIFGIGHLVQGWDAVVTTTVLGALWGIIYIRRRSILAPLVSHAGFNAAEILRYTLVGS
jgi:membrane protease YdiL (CAAX protease family)